MNSAELIGVMRNVAPILREYVVSALGPLQQRLADLEARPPIKGDKGEDADPELIRLAVIEEVERLPKPQNGKDADEAVIANIVAEAISKLPKPQDNKNDEIRQRLDAHAEHIDAVMIEVADLKNKAVPDDIATLVAKAAALMAEPMPSPVMPQNSPVIVSLASHVPQQRRTIRKTIVSRKNASGEIVSEVTEQEVA